MPNTKFISYEVVVLNQFYKTFGNKFVLLIGAFLVPFVMTVWQIVNADNGALLLSPYVESDTALFHYSAWFKATFSVNSYVSDIIVLSPYERLMSFVIKSFGYSNISPFVMNCVLHALSCVCVFITSWLVFDKRTAFIALIIYVLCAPLLYFAGTTSKTNLVIFLIALSNMVAVLFFQYLRLWLAVIFVAVIMFCFIERVHVFVSLAVFLSLLFVLRGSTPLRSYYNKAIIAALLIVAFLFGVSAIKFGVEPKYFSSVGLNVYLGHTKPDNHKLRLDGVRNHLIGHRIDSREVAEKELDKKLTQSEVTFFWLEKTWAYIKQNPSQYLLSQRQKLHHLFAKISHSFRTEMVNLWRAERKPLKFAFFDFGSIFALFLIGCYLVFKEGMQTKTASYHARLFLIFSGSCYLLSIMLTIVTERYRLGSLVFMIPIAAFTLNKFIAKPKQHLALIFTSLSIFAISYVLMVTAPANYHSKEQVQRYQRSELGLLGRTKIAGFYSTRENLSENINKDDCRVLITHLKKIRFHWDVKKIKEFCLYKRK